MKNPEKLIETFSIDTRRELVAKLLSLGLSLTDVSKASGIDISTVRNDSRKKQDQIVGDGSFNFLIRCRLRMNKGDLGPVDNALRAALDAHLDMPRLNGIAEAIIVTSNTLLRPADPPEYIPYRKLLYALFGGKAENYLTEGDLLFTYFFDGITSDKDSLERKSFAAKSIVWMTENFIDPVYGGPYGISSLPAPLSCVAVRKMNREIESLGGYVKEVIRLRFGLNDGMAMTFPEIISTLNLNVGIERIRQIEARGLRMLRHQSRGLEVLTRSAYEIVEQELERRFNPPLQVPKNNESKVTDDCTGSLCLKVEEIELSVRTYNTLVNARIETVGDLVRMSEREFLSKKGCIRKVLNELKKVLDTLGLSFREDTTPL